jgi:hypothetical protein
MGALEALNGWIMFGLTTEFHFTVIQKARPHAYDTTGKLKLRRVRPSLL